MSAAYHTHVQAYLFFIERFGECNSVIWQFCILVAVCVLYEQGSPELRDFSGVCSVLHAVTCTLLLSV